MAIFPPQADAQLPALVDLNVTPGSEAAPVVRVYGGDNNDQLGNPYSNGLAHGDFDADGLDDIIIGAFRADPETPGYRSFGGEAYILFGSTLSAPQSINLADPLGTYGECRILGDDSSDYFGTAVATGDINGDGYDDAVVGARGADQGAFDLFVGEVYVIYGHPSMASIGIDLSQPPGSNGETRILGDDPNDYFGYSIATGDVNGDGFDDIIAGAHFADSGPSTQAGEAVVKYGSASLPGSTVDLRNPPGSQDETRIIGRPIAAFAGTSVASGDIDGDGYADVLVAAPNATILGRSGAGEVFVVFGRPDLSGLVFDMNDPPGSHGEIRIWGDDQADELGHSLAVGDINADGFDDVIVGARRGNQGNVVVLYGNNSLPGPVIDLDATIGAFGETRIKERNPNDLGGSGVASADINGDGFEDILIGSPDADATGDRNGEAYLVYGSTTLPGQYLQLSSGDEDVRILGDGTVGFLGIGVGADGDVNRDGFADFTASASHGKNVFLGSAANREGYAALVFGSGTAPSATAVESFHADATPRHGMGGRLSPTLRTWVSFSDGDAGTVTATLERNTNNVLNFSFPDHLAPLAWNLATTRLNWSTASVTFQYTDGEVAGLLEDDLKVYQSATPDGPWVEVATQSLDTTRNTVEVDVTELGYFVLADKGTSALPLTVAPILALLIGLHGLWRVSAMKARQ